jgi:hypothetical protein
LEISYGVRLGLSSVEPWLLVDLLVVPLSEQQHGEVARERLRNGDPDPYGGAPILVA